MIYLLFGKGIVYLLGCCWIVDFLCALLGCETQILLRQKSRDICNSLIVLIILSKVMQMRYLQISIFVDYNII